MIQSSSTNPRIETLYQQFIKIIETYERGEVTSRGLAQMAEKATSTQELEQLNDELLNHTFWAARHLLHRPACWAPHPEEIQYLLRCLRGDEPFVQETADSYRT